MKVACEHRQLALRARVSNLIVDVLNFDVNLNGLIKQKEGRVLEAECEGARLEVTAIAEIQQFGAWEILVAFQTLSRNEAAVLERDVLGLHRGKPRDIALFHTMMHEIFIAQVLSLREQEAGIASGSTGSR